MPRDDTEHARFGRTGPTREMGPEERRAVAPLGRLVGRWALESTRIGPGMPEAGRAFTGPDAPVDLDRLESNVYAGGKVMVINYAGRFGKGMNSPTTGLDVQAGERFSGFLALTYDAPNKRYIQLYADDLGTVALSTTERWEVEGETLRLHFADEQMGNYVAEFVSDGPTKLTYNLYGADGSELLKSATVRRE
jgi:hypothetical protein